MKTVVVTCVLGKVPYARHTIPTLKNYASKTNSDFIIIDHSVADYKKLHFQKFQFLDLIIKNSYDKAVFLDADIKVLPHSKNIFDVFGDIAVVTDRETRIFDEYPNELLDDENTKKRYNALNKQFKFENQYDYFNSGVMGLSYNAAVDWKSNLDLKIKNPLTDYDQYLFNYLLNVSKYKPTFLDSRYNATAAFDTTNNYTHYFIHYKAKKSWIGTSKDRY